ncbi:hypothetical protein [Pseudomonas sp. TTU2014-080ASC]|uniref:hypothetical protein n=1 Tax=Pseudomonas sp. TTU2014-080ASC TaxID=1729724 RepID=UPI0007189AB1|nr:hypothetical protein [Pseudomonas sp. TTU2014-080ASC]KRW61646.1 hypothetical protein AO726_10065 [Pseudomonas sp. TTU2014-080ASC]
MHLRNQLFDDQRDAMTPILYGYFGFSFVTDHGSFVTNLISVDASIPEFTAIVVTIVELSDELALLLGFWIGPIAALFVHFFKNVSIAAVFLFSPCGYSI